MAHRNRARIEPTDDPGTGMRCDRRALRPYRM
jgi:hypothetical protein